MLGQSMTFRVDLMASERASCRLDVSVRVALSLRHWRTVSLKSGIARDATTATTATVTTSSTSVKPCWTCRRAGRGKDRYFNLQLRNALYRPQFAGLESHRYAVVFGCLSGKKHSFFTPGLHLRHGYQLLGGAQPHSSDAIDGDPLRGADARRDLQGGHPGRHHPRRMKYEALDISVAPDASDARGSLRDRDEFVFGAELAVFVDVLKDQPAR